MLRSHLAKRISLPEKRYIWVVCKNSLSVIHSGHQCRREMWDAALHWWLPLPFTNTSLQNSPDLLRLEGTRMSSNKCQIQFPQVAYSTGQEDETTSAGVRNFCWFRTRIKKTKSLYRTAPSEHRLPVFLFTETKYNRNLNKMPPCCSFTSCKAVPVPI